MDEGLKELSFIRNKQNKTKQNLIEFDHYPIPIYIGSIVALLVILVPVLYMRDSMQFISQGYWSKSTDSTTVWIKKKNIKCKKSTEDIICKGFGTETDLAGYRSHFADYGSTCRSFKGPYKGWERLGKKSFACNATYHFRIIDELFYWFFLYLKKF